VTAAGVSCRGGLVIVSSLVVLLMLAAAALAVFAWFSAKRREELKKWAEANGLTLRAGRDSRLDELYPRFGCLRRGGSRYAYHIVEGPWHRRSVTAFDYHYATGSGKNRQDHRFSAIVLASEVPLQPLSIRPEGILDKVTEFFGLDDIDFESAEFSRTFHVTSKDRRWAYDVIHQGAMEFLLGMPRFAIQFDVGSVIVWRGHRFDPKTFEAAIQVAEGLLDRLPSYLVR
jgi:hypothetical protein